MIGALYPFVHVLNAGTPFCFGLGESNWNVTFAIRVVARNILVPGGICGKICDIWLFSARNYKIFDWLVKTRHFYTLGCWASGPKLLFSGGLLKWVPGSACHHCPLHPVLLQPCLWFHKRKTICAYPIMHWVWRPIYRYLWRNAVSDQCLHWKYFTFAGANVRN